MLHQRKQPLNIFINNSSLKRDHQNRPLWISTEGIIYLENFSPIHEQAQDFLVAIAEPISRPSFIHEYRLTPYSLYAAVSVGLETEDIIDVLKRLTKTEIPTSVLTFIRQCTVSHGKVKLVLKHNKYFIESAHASILQFLLKDPIIKQSRVITPSEMETNEGIANDITDGSGFLNKFTLKGTATKDKNIKETIDYIALKYDSYLKDAQDGETYDDTEVNQQEQINETVHSFEIDSAKVESVKKRCVELEYPTLEEYDFKNDERNPNLEIDLRASTVIRPYQEKSLSKMFGNG